MSVELKATEQMMLSIAPKDRKGNPAPIDGAAVWAIDNPEVASLDPSTDGLNCLVRASKVGTARISVEVDAAVGPEVQTLGGIVDLSVIPGVAVNLSIDVGEPEEQPEE